MPSFDTVIEPNLVEVRNAVDQTAKEIGTRFDFKGSSAAHRTGRQDDHLHADSDFQIGQVTDILLAKLTKRGVDIRFLDRSAKIEKIGGDKVKAGADGQERRRQRQRQEDPGAIKDSKLKVQAAIQGDTVRVSGAKRDDLQAAMQLIKKTVPDAPVLVHQPARLSARCARARRPAGLLPVLAAAQSVSMSGSLGDKALLVIDGAPRTVAAGATVCGREGDQRQRQPDRGRARRQRQTLVLGGAAGQPGRRSQRRRRHDPSRWPRGRAALRHRAQRHDQRQGAVRSWSTPAPPTSR